MLLGIRGHHFVTEIVEHRVIWRARWHHAARHAHRRQLLLMLMMMLLLLVIVVVLLLLMLLLMVMLLLLLLLLVLVVRHLVELHSWQMRRYMRMNRGHRRVSMRVRPGVLHL